MHFGEKEELTVDLTRRDAIKLIGSTAALAAIGEVPAFSSTAFKPMLRMPLDEFVKNPKWLAALRNGVREMKRRKPSDPLSWFFQAAIHGVTKEAIERATKDDANVPNVVKYWNQCPHKGESSANFLPWHRGYTYHFEQILRLHTGDPSFSLPYWNYHPKKNRKFPREFGVEHLDGNLENNVDENINPLFHAARDFYFAGYEHPFAKGLPLLALSDTAVDISLPMRAAAFFGGTEREGLGGGVADTDASTRGLLESYPHDHIHRSVGGIVTAANPVRPDDPDCQVALGAMSTPPTAGFDPIFCVHHANIDRLWAKWSCMPGKKWGKLPPRSWFEERPWFFFDTNGNVVNEPRKSYFDHHALGVRFYDEDASCKPLSLPEMTDSLFEMPVAGGAKSFTLRKLARTATGVAVPAISQSSIAISITKHDELRTTLTKFRSPIVLTQVQDRIFMRLEDVRIGKIQGTGFDVHVTAAPDSILTRESESFAGSITLFRHPSMADGHGMHSEVDGSDSMTEIFDVSSALRAVGRTGLDYLHVVFVPYSLLEIADTTGALISAVFVNRESLTVGAIDFSSLETGMK